MFKCVVHFQVNLNLNLNLNLNPNPNPNPNLNLNLNLILIIQLIHQFVYPTNYKFIIINYQINNL